MTKDAFTEGQLVRVEARTWPGINKHGGVGRIVRRIENEVDVQYVLGGGEKGVPLEYVSIIEEVWSQKSLRDRSILLGRCKHCGSLRADCGSCDLQQQYQQAIEMAGAGPNPRQAKQVGIVLDDRNGYASSDNFRPLPITKRKQHENTGNLQMNTPHQEILNSDCEESDSSSDDEFLLAFQNNPRLRRNLALLNRLERDTRPRIPNAKERTMDIVDCHSDGAEMTQNLSQSKLESSRVMTSDDEKSQSFSVPQRSRHQRMQDSLTSAAADPSLSPHPEGELLVDNDLDGFIQPEGAATSAPRGSEDNTRHLAFRELPGFFDATVNRVGDALPEARAALRDIARRVEIRESVCGQTSDLEEEGWQLYSSSKELLVLSGLDQCRYMYPRLTSRVELRKHEATLSSREKKQFGEKAQSIRDILFDQTDKEVEDFLRELRHYLADLKSSRDDELFGEVDSVQSLSSQESHNHYSEEGDFGWASASHVLRDFDPHQHASRIPQGVCSKRSRPRSLGRDKRKRPRTNSQVEVPSMLGGIISGRYIGSRLVNPKRRSVALNARKRTPAETPDIARPTNIEFQPSGTLNRKGRSVALSASNDFPTSGRAGKRESAVADRMQAFLDANRENIDACLDSVPAVKTQCHPRLSVVRITDESNAASLALSTSSIRNYDEEIFRTLSMIETVTPVSHDVREDKPGILHCIEVLRQHCQTSPPADEFLDRVYRDSQSDDALMSNDDVASIFSVIHSYLKKNPESLQELIATSRTKLSRHLQVLEALFTLFSMDLQRQLQKIDGIVFSLFSGDEPCCFVQLLILQMLDVLFAFFNPDAWATDSFPKIDILGIFAPLRDALARLVPLVELSCQYVLHRVECQRWFKSRDGSMSFVSSVDPDMYSSFLETAEIPSAVCVRMKQFNSKIPRVEVNTIWSLLGFLAASNARTSAPTSKHRWLLVYNILCCETGVLPRALEGHERTKPSTNHIARCEVELGYLKLLVSRGAMMPLDGTDKIIGTVLKRLILLQANSIRGDVYFYRTHEVSFSTEKVLDEWESSSLRNESADVEPRSVVLDRHFLLPGLLQNGVDLLASWTSQSRNKPVLWTQLALSISKLQELEKSYPTSTIGDLTFTKLFQQHEIRGTFFVREAAVAVLTAFDIVRSECTITAKKPYVSRAAMSRTWSLISDSLMKLRHDGLNGNVVHRQTRDSKENPCTLCFTAIRSFCMYLFAHFGEPVAFVNGGADAIAPLDGNRNSMGVTHQYLLHESLSFIFVSLDHMCSDILAMRSGDSHAESIVTALSLSLTWISQIAGFCRKQLGCNNCRVLSGELRSELHMVGSSILKLCAKTLGKCMFAVLSLSQCNGADTCFRLCTTTIRNVVAWTVIARADDRLTSDSGEFDHLDDPAFLCVEDEVETPADVLSQTILKLLENANPSNIYRVDRDFSVGETAPALDSNGRDILYRCSGRLCACLASLVAAGSKCDFKAALACSALGRPGIDRYKRYFTFALLTENCKLADSFPQCKTSLEQTCDTFIMTLLDMVLDADSLERFPTCDIEIMMNLTGSQGARRERKRLNRAYGKGVAQGGLGVRKGEEIDEIGPVYVCRNLWRCTQDFRKIASVQASVSPLACQLQATEYETDIECSHYNSLEMECLRRMKFVLSFFRVDAVANVEGAFEDTLMLAVKSSMLNLLTIAEGLLYHDLKRQKSSAESQPGLTHAHCKLVVLQASYVEMFVGTICNVVLANWYTFSDKVRHSLSSLREVLVFSMSNYMDNDIESCFRQLVGHPERRDSCQRVFAPMLDLRKCVKLACLRRSREVIRHHLALAPRADRQRGVIALVATASSFVSDATTPCEYVLDVIAEGFRMKSESSLSSTPGRPIFQDYVDEHIFRAKEASRTTGAAEETLLDIRVRNLRMFVLSKVIPPRLRNRSQATQSAKAALVGLANRLLYIEIDDLGASTGMKAESALELHDLLTSLWEVMCESMKFRPESCALLTSTLRCLSLIMTLPIIGIDGQTMQSMLRWSRLSTKQSLFCDCTLPDKTSLETFACYLSTLAALAFHASSFFCQPNSISSISMGRILEKADGATEGDVLHISVPSLDALTIESLVSQLHLLKKAVDYKNKDKGYVPRNIYIRHSNEMGVHGLRSALEHVSPEVKREAANLKAVIEVCYENEK